MAATFVLQIRPPSGRGGLLRPAGAGLAGHLAGHPAGPSLHCQVRARPLNLNLVAVKVSHYLEKATTKGFLLVEIHYY